MTNTDKPHDFPAPANAPGDATPEGSSAVDQPRVSPPSAREFGENSWPAALTADGPDSGFASSRCVEKGCVFPVARRGAGKCLHHDRQQREPKLFHSLQPTLLVLARAKFGVRDPEGEDTRALDRRRQAMVREAFLEEAA